MAGGKISVRQKMINMMYLVLTALLALNVSAEILKAFYLVEQSMDKAGQNIDAKNQDIIAQFEKENKNQPEKVGPWLKKAQQAMQINNDFVSQVQAIKDDLVAQTGGREESKENFGELKGRSNMEVHANIMIKQGKASELKNLINKTREDLLALLPEKDRPRVKSDLVAENQEGSTRDWESTLFEHTPLAAVITLLTKIQNDAKSTTAEVIAALYANITASDQSFDQLRAQIIPKSTFVISGGKFQADVFLSAYDSKQTNDVVINGKTFTPEAGIVTYEVPTGSPGTFKVKGEIMVKGKDGIKPYPFETEYTVFQGAATISADAMNVLYIGLDNPVSVSVPGFAPELVTPSISGGGGSLTKEKGNQYVCKVSQRGDATISVSVKVDGQGKAMGSQKFRVRAVPKPEGQLGTLQSGTHSLGAIKAQNAIFASLGEGFAFENVKYQVTSYNFTLSPRRGDAKFARGEGGALSPQVKSYINAAKSGDKIIVSDIQAKGPGGNRTLSPIVIDVN